MADEGRMERPDFKFRPCQSFLRSFSVGRVYTPSGSDREDKMMNDGSISAALFLVCVLSMLTIFQVFKNGLIAQTVSVFQEFIQLVPFCFTILCTLILVTVTCCSDKKRISWIHCQHDRNILQEKPKWKMVAVSVFGIGCIIINIFFIYDHSHCLKDGGYLSFFNGIWMVNCLLQIVFVAMQIMYMYDISMNGWRYHNHPLLSYALLLTISCNVSWYLSYFTVELKQAIDYTTLHTNESVTYTFCINLENKTEFNNFMRDARRYLMPFITEYNIVATEIMLHIWSTMESLKRVGTITNRQSGLSTEPRPSSPQAGPSKESTPFLSKPKGYGSVATSGGGDVVRHRRPGASCDIDEVSTLPTVEHHSPEDNEHEEVPEKPNRGWVRLVAPFILILCVVHTVTLVLLDIDVDYPHGVMGYIHRSISIAMQVMIYAAVVCGYWCLDASEHQSVTCTGNDILLLIATIGYIILYVLRCGAAFICMTGVESICQRFDHKGSPNFSTEMPILVFIQTSMYLLNNWLQTMFIIHASRQSRPLDKKVRAKLKMVVWSLSIINLFQWAKKSFVDLNVERAFAVARAVYPLQMWTAILRFAYPFSLFFHFHSAVLLIRYYETIKSYRNLN